MVIQNFDKSTIDRAYWLTAHRLAIRKWTTVSLYIVIGFVYAWFFVQFGIYLYAFNQWDTLAADAIKPRFAWNQIHQTNAPLLLEFGNPSAFGRGANKYDLVVEVFNPNKHWAIRSLSYQFTVGDVVLPARQAFIMPGERKFLTFFNYQASAPIQQVDGFVDFDHRWQKVISLPPVSWIFASEPRFQSRRQIAEGTRQTIIPAEVTWSVTNASTITYPEVIWQIAVYGSNDRIVWVGELRSENISFLENRDYNISIFESLPRVKQVTVSPIVNLLLPEYAGYR